MTDLIGKIFDRKYRLTRLIGEGGMGAVYEAEHTLIERKVAVKVMHNEFSASDEVVNRFFREAQASSAIGHPNIIEIFDVGLSDDGTAFIVMELLEGESLSDRLKREGIIAPSTAVSIILQVLSALSMAHQKGIIHRDLKPDNIFLAIDNRGRHEVKLLDFGIAKVQGELEGDQGLTKTGTVLGTPNYMSPEQARGKEIDGRIDIWSAGVMLYEMLCGQLPFRGDSYNAVLSDILLEMPEPIGLRVPNLPLPLVNVIEKAMAKNRDDRYSDVQLMIEDLLPFHDSTAALMSNTAETALKNSIAPAPAALYRQSAAPLSDTAALTPDPDVMKAMAPPNPTSQPSKQLGNMTFRELEFGGDDPLPHGSRRIGLWVLAILLFVSIVTFGSLAAYTKKPGQSFMESGSALFGRARSALDHAEWSPFKRDQGPPPDVADPEKGPEIRPPNIEQDEPGPEAVFDEENSVTILLTGLPENSKVLLNGKPVGPEIDLPYSHKPATLRVQMPGKRPFIKKIIPTEDHTIDFDSATKQKKKKRRKKSNKK